MLFFQKIFSIKKDEYNYIICILGLKLKLRSIKLLSKKVKKISKGTRSDLINFHRNFLYTHIDKLSYNEKKWYLETRFYEQAGYFANLKNPKTFNEKINWLKLNYNNPLQERCVDKYEFKNYIKEKLGENYVIPLLGVYDDVNDIDFEYLPEKFVIKSTVIDGAIGVCVVKDKSKLNIDELKYKFNNLIQPWMNMYYYDFLPAYKNVKNRIIIEEYLEGKENQLYDYKFFCFHGDVKFMYLAVDHFPNVISKISAFDTNWNILPLKYGSHPAINRKIEKPKNFDEMLEISRTLSKDFPFVRVDLYENNGNIYVGELTFDPTGGFGTYQPADWDKKMGEWIDLKQLPEEYLINN